MTMAAMNMVSKAGFSGVSFHLRRCPQGVASVLCKKTPIFESRRSKLDHLTVLTVTSMCINRRGRPSRIIGDKKFKYHGLDGSSQIDVTVHWGRVKSCDEFDIYMNWLDILLDLKTTVYLCSGTVVQTVNGSSKSHIGRLVTWNWKTS